jgi:histidinol-phosphate aminotransferase
LLVLDEAYGEFAPLDMFGLLKEYDHLLITRTFSKAAGIAGLRVGYCLGHPRVIEQVSKAKLPYSVNCFSLVAAEMISEALEILGRHVQLLVTERTRILEALRQMPGVKAYDSKANFIFFRVERDPKEVFQALLEKNILVRDVSRYPLLEGGLRVSVGTPDDNATFLQAMAEIMNTA